MNATTQSNEKPVPPIALPVDLRDYFAAKAMQADISSMNEQQDPADVADVIARRAYIVADAMLKERAK